MYARAVQQLPDGKDWLYEVKFDGYRCLAGRDSSGVTLWSRRGNQFTDQFPTVAEACEHLPPDTLLDGELIALDKEASRLITAPSLTSRRKDAHSGLSPERK